MPEPTFDSARERYDATLTRLAGVLPEAADALRSLAVEPSEEETPVTATFDDDGTPTVGLSPNAIPGTSDAELDIYVGGLGLMVARDRDAERGDRHPTAWLMASSIEASRDLQDAGLFNDDNAHLAEGVDRFTGQTMDDLYAEALAIGREDGWLPEPGEIDEPPGPTR